MTFTTSGRLDPHVIIPALRGLKPGEQITYHVGHLAYDRSGAFQSNRSLEITHIARVAMELSDEGKLRLVQRARGEPSFMGVRPGYEYIAIGAAL